MSPRRSDGTRESGQILPLALAGFVAATFFFLFLIKAGDLLIQRERASMRTDVTAISIGVDYARSLNVLASINKLVGAGHIATLIPGLSKIGREAVKALQKAQDVILVAGPWMNEASAMHLGAQNGLVAVPLWNSADLGQSLFKRDPDNVLKPDYLIQQQGLFDLIASGLSGWMGQDLDAKDVEKAVRKGEKDLREMGNGSVLKEVEGLAKKQLPSLDLSWLLEKAGYSFQPKSGGPRVYVPKDGGRDQLERKAGGGNIVRSHENEKNRYVHVEKQLDGDVPLKLIDDDDHYITLIAPFVPQLDPQARPTQP